MKMQIVLPTKKISKIPIKQEINPTICVLCWQLEELRQLKKTEFRKNHENMINCENMWTVNLQKNMHLFCHNFGIFQIFAPAEFTYTYSRWFNNTESCYRIFFGSTVIELKLVSCIYVQIHFILNESALNYINEVQITKLFV